MRGGGHARSKRVTRLSPHDAAEIVTLAVATSVSATAAGGKIADAAGAWMNARANGRWSRRALAFNVASLLPVASLEPARPVELVASLQPVGCQRHRRRGSVRTPGGSRGLQSRCRVVRAARGGFDSHPLPWSWPHLCGMIQLAWARFERVKGSVLCVVVHNPTSPVTSAQVAGQVAANAAIAKRT